MVRTDILLLFCHFPLSGFPFLTSSVKAQMGTIKEKNPADTGTPLKQEVSGLHCELTNISVEQ